MLFKTPTLFLKVKKSNFTNIFVLVPKKLLSKSTQRNLLKRRIKNSIKELLKSRPKNKTLILYAQKGIEKQNYKEIKKNIESLLDEAGF